MPRWAIRVAMSSMTNTYSSGAVAIRLVADFGEAGLDCRIALCGWRTSHCELAGAACCATVSESGSGVVVNGLVLELADGTTIPAVSGRYLVAMTVLSHGSCAAGDVGCLTVKYAYDDVGASGSGA